jgi:hypothetical protein
LLGPKSSKTKLIINQWYTMLSINKKSLFIVPLAL